MYDNNNTYIYLNEKKIKYLTLHINWDFYGVIHKVGINLASLFSSFSAKWTRHDEC